MKINTASLDAAFRGFKAVYHSSFEATESFASEIAMTVASQSSEEEYGWLGQFPELREWVDERVIKKLSEHGFTIKNKKFESTVVVGRDKLSDDKIGVYKPMFSEMGRVTKTHPDKMVFGLLKAGFETACYDGQNFFDTDHPTTVDAEEISVSNMQAGTDPSWYLLDTSRAIKPVIWQEREGYEFTSITAPDDYSVYMKDEYIYGIRARVNAGFGLWQLAYASKAPLTAENYELARAAMMATKTTDGQVMGVRPTVLVVPPALEGAGRKLLLSGQSEGSSNIWHNTAKLIVSFDVA